jgi:3-(3-hydroxy-phenyl)propionate hydroxylase
MADLPVLVVGAGPSGLTLANLLGLFGAEVILIERNPGTVGEPRAVSIDDESLRTMQAVGLIDEVGKDVVMKGYGYHYMTPKGQSFAQVLPSVADYGYPRRCPFQQPLLEAALRSGLDRFPKVRAQFGHRLDSFSQDADGVTAQITGSDGRTQQIRAAYLAGCDGGSSTVRKALGIPLVGSSFEERWLVLDIVNRRDRIEHTRVFCSANRPAITLPGPNGTRRWEFLLRKDETDEQALSLESVRSLLALYDGDTEAEIVRKIVYTFHARTAERWREGRVFLLGDAAHLTPPFAGQGMNSGIRDAQNLAWKLAAVQTGRLGAGVLDSYERERKPHAWELIMMAVKMGRVMNPVTPLREFLLINAIRIASLVPSVRDYFMQMKFKPKPRFAEGFLVAGEGPRDELVGRMFPQPKVATPEGEKKLDDLLGTGFALLACGPEATSALAAATQAVWDRLGARRVAISPAEDVSGRLAALFPPGATRLVLLRPDRYVAGVAAPEELVRFAENVSALIERAKTPAFAGVTP